MAVGKSSGTSKSSRSSRSSRSTKSSQSSKSTSRKTPTKSLSKADKFSKTTRSDKSKQLIQPTGSKPKQSLSRTLKTPQSRPTQTLQKTAQQAPAQITPQAAPTAAQTKAPTPTAQPETPIGKILGDNKEIKTNQDVINHFVKEAGGSYAKAAQNAKDIGVDLNQLTKARQGAASGLLPQPEQPTQQAQQAQPANVPIPQPRPEMPQAAQDAAAAGAAAAAETAPTNAVGGNGALQGIDATGASARTARQDRITSGGVDASHQMAKTDEQRVMKHKDIFEEMGKKYDVPPALLAAIASRETRGGNILDRRGYGDHGNGYGLMQVDKRYHTIQGTDSPSSRAHIEQATSILADFHKQIKDANPGWTPQQQLQGAVAAYNAGASRMKDPSTFDRVTTGRDYSNDVLARAQYYAQNW